MGRMTGHPLPPWPRKAPAFGRIRLRGVRAADAGMAQEMSTDPYVPAIGTLAPNANRAEALAWVLRQQRRHGEGSGFSFTIQETATGAAAGHCGLWLGDLAEGRGSAGYCIAPSSRGRGLGADALSALTAFGWTVPGLVRIELYIEPWNTGSLKTAEAAGYARAGSRQNHPLADGSLRPMLVCAAVRPAAASDGRKPRGHYRL